MPSLSPDPGFDYHYKTCRKGDPDAKAVAVQLPNVSLLWFRGEGFCTLSQALIEAFLDDWCRNEIFTGLASERSTEVLKWLSKYGVKVYRKLHDPRLRQDVAVEAVFPPEMDFLEGA